MQEKLQRKLYILNFQASEAAALAREEAAENATTVTRFLIKHLPKQLSQLRHDKSELEDKIRDLDTLISNQVPSIY